MKRWNNLFTVVTVALLAGLPTTTQAKKPGGSGDEAAPFSVVELPGFSRPHAVSNPDYDNLVTVAGDGSEAWVAEDGSGASYTSATYAVVDVTTRAVVSGFLPEPTDNSPQGFPDFASTARDVNTAGVIVGAANVYVAPVPPAITPTRRNVAIRWIPQGTGYVFELLPLLSGDTYGDVAAINEEGEMVGTSATSIGGRAVYWSADGLQIVELNSLLPENSGWSLFTAADINSSGQVVGRGLLGGVTRGYLLDLTTLEIITAVPLVTGAETNEAWQINDIGHVIGKEGGWGFYWAGPGAQPQLLPSSTNGAPIARGINNFDELAGESRILDRRGNEVGLEMSSWLPDETGGFTTAPLDMLIPTKPQWDLEFGFAINDDLWICGTGLKTFKGGQSEHGVLVIPSPPSPPE